MDSTHPFFMNTTPHLNECADVVEFFWSVHNDQTTRPLVQALFGFLYTMIFLTGILGNGLVIASVWKYQALQTVRNFFIVSLSCSDIVVCLTSLPITPFMIIKKNWLFGSFLCYAFPLFQGMSICISTFTLMAVAIDRYILIIFPTKRPIQRNQAIPMIIGIWALAAGVCLPMVAHYKYYYGPDRPSELNLALDSTTMGYNTEAWEWNTTQTTTPMNVTMAPTMDVPTSLPLFCDYFCDEAWPSERVQKIYGTFVLILQFMVPLLVIAVCYSHIWFRVSRSAKMKNAMLGARKKYAQQDTNESMKLRAPLTDTQSSAASALEARQQAVLRRQRRTNRMLIAMVFVFACSWAPQVLVNLLRDLDFLPEFIWKQMYLYSLLCHVIAMTSTVWNPLLYSFMNSAFRNAFTELLPCLRPLSRALTARKAAIEARKSVQFCQPDPDSNMGVCAGMETLAQTNATITTKMNTGSPVNTKSSGYRRGNSSRADAGGPGGPSGGTSETAALLPHKLNVMNGDGGNMSHQEYL